MSKLEEQYPIVLIQDVIWGDMDAFEHVNNTVYFRYFEDARLEFFKRFGVNEYKAEHSIGPILASTSCNFKLPLTFPDRVHIGGRYTILSPKKISMEYAVYSERLDGIAAEGEGLLVYYDYGQGRSCEIPHEILDRLE
ncbi:MAG: thioesterase family protein [Pseudomonadota bacterium]